MIEIKAKADGNDFLQVTYGKDEMAKAMEVVARLVEGGCVVEVKLI